MFTYKKNLLIILFSFLVACSGESSSPNLSNFSNSNYYDYYLFTFMDFDSDGDKEAICFQDEDTTDVLPCYDFELVENLPEGGILPSADPIAFFEIENDEYIKGSNYSTAIANNFRINGIPLLWALPLIVLYGIYKLWGLRNVTTKKETTEHTDGGTVDRIPMPDLSEEE